MDELKMIGDMLDEPPTEQAAATGRRRLREEIVDPSGKGSGRVKARRGIPRFPLFSGLGLLAAGTAAAVAITIMGPGAPPSSGGGSPQPAHIDLGKQAVLAAAENAAKQKAGKYWHYDGIWGQSYIVRPEMGSYAVVGAHRENFGWVEVATGTGRTWGRELPARPLTPKDEAAWKKAGSPSKFRVWSNDHYYTYDRSKTEWEKYPANRSEGPGWIDGMTFEELRKMAANPEKLADFFLTPAVEKAKHEREFFVWKAKRQGKDPDAYLRGPMGCIRPATIASRLLILDAGSAIATPLPPAARAGLMRELAEMPGIESIGTAVDPLGREGVALASEVFQTCRSDEYGAPPEEVGKYKSREMIIFDEETGKVLATQSVLAEPGGPYKDREPGFVINYRIYRDMGFTDTKPEPSPELPPF